MIDQEINSIESKQKLGKPDWFPVIARSIVTFINQGFFGQAREETKDDIVVVESVKNNSERQEKLEYWPELSKCLREMIKDSNSIEDSLYNQIHTDNFDINSIPKLWPQIAQSLVLLVNNSSNLQKNLQAENVFKDLNDIQDCNSEYKQSDIKNINEDQQKN